MLVRAGGEGCLDPEAIVVGRAVGPCKVTAGMLVLQAQPHEFALPEGQEGWVHSDLVQAVLVVTQNGDGTYAVDSRWEKSF